MDILLVIFGYVFIYAIIGQPANLTNYLISIAGATFIFVGGLLAAKNRR